VKILKIWEDILDCSKRIGIDDNFFEVGGTSLLTVRCLAAARDVGIDGLLIKHFFTCGTVRSIAAMLEEEMMNCRNKNESCSNEWSCLVEMNIHSSDLPNLYIVHPAGGNVFCFRNLSKHLDGAVNVFALQLPKDCVEESLECLADMYLEEILQAHKISAQRNQRIHVAGYSFGASVAFAMAQHLHSAKMNGLSVYDVSLFLLDSCPNLDDGRWTDVADLREQGIIEFYEYYMPGGEEAGVAALSADDIIDLESDAKLQAISDSLPTRGHKENLRNIVSSYVYTSSLVERYQAVPYNGDAFLFVAEDDVDEELTSTASGLVAHDGNTSVQRGLRTFSVPGDHLTMLDDAANAAVVANIFKELIM
jgi:thioesterase domain-containing protein